MATKKEKITYPKVTVGTHLTVTEHEDGKTELLWDDEQLLKEVRAAIASIEKKPKRTTKVKNSVEVSMDVIEKAKKSSKKTVAKKAVATKKKVSK